MIPKDFPEWFEKYIEEQLKEVPSFTEPSSCGMDNLTMAYLRLWSVFETFAKIVFKLYEKRCSLKEVEAKINEVKSIEDRISDWTSNATKVVESYKVSIEEGVEINLVENVTKCSLNLKAITVSKYSTRKSDIALMKLPTAVDIVKSCTELGFDSTKLSYLLEPANSDSKFYKTRNKIAHEGKADIQLTNFITARINPVREVVENIREQVNAT